MNEQRVRVGVIGAGRFAEECHVPGVQAHPRGEVVALCARNRERAAAMAARLNVRHVYTDYQELLARSDIDAVILATPDALHLPVTLAALEAGKHVLCEKPLAMNADEAHRMVDAAQRSGLVAMVAFTFRYTRALPELRRLLREGVIGRPFQVILQVYWGGIITPGMSLTWREQAVQSAAGIWGDAGSHLFDALSYAVAPAEAVCAQLMIVQRDEGPAQPDTIDSISALARLRLPAIAYNLLPNPAAAAPLADRDLGAVHVTLMATRVAHPRGPVHEMQVVGTKGALGLPLFRGQHEYLSILRPGASSWEELPLPNDAYTDQPLALRRMVAAFIDAVRRGHLNPDQDADFAAGLHAQRALEAGIRSASSCCWESV